MLLMIDNYDSFTYNLVQYFLTLNEKVKVVRNDKITIDQIKSLNPSHIVISPGPGTPDDAGISLDIIKKLGDNYPILGICLGHQCIAQAFGGEVVHAKEIMHGKISSLSHEQKGLFKELPNLLKVARYHSLVASSDKLPSCLETHATLNDDKTVIMALKHTKKPIYGVQFHPESIMTEHGMTMLKNFLLETS